MHMKDHLQDKIVQILQQIEALRRDESVSRASALNVLKNSLDELRSSEEMSRKRDLACKSDERALRQMVSQSPDRFFRQDRELRYTWISHASLFGHTSSDLIGKTSSEIIPPKEAMKLTDAKRRVMETGKGVRAEAHMPINGVEHYFDAFYEPWRDSAGEIVGIAGFVRDITESKQADTEIRKMTKAVETAPAAIVLTDLKGMIEYVNPGFLEMGGFKDASEVLGRSVFEFTDDVGKSKLMEEIIPALNSKGQWRGEMPVQNKGKKAYFVEMICALVNDDSGRPNYFLANFYNITDRKRAEEALLLNESRLEALLNLNQMDEATIQEITDFALEAGVKLTSSRLGYLAFVDDEEKTLVMHSWSKNAMKECKAHKRTVYPLETTGLWGEALRQRRSIITNDYSASTLKKGLPEGHVKVLRHMNIPIFDKGKVVAVAGVGNKEEEYDDSDVRQLTLLMSGMWKLIQRRKGEEELLKRDRLLQGVALATNYLLTSDPQAILKSLEILGASADVDRVYILENYNSKEGELRHCLLMEWVRGQVSPYSGNIDLESISYKTHFPGWYETLASGYPIQGTTKDIAMPGREMLEKLGIVSFLLVPIFIDGRFAEVIGFDDCKTSRRWTDNEIAVLQAAAGSIGEAVVRRRAETALKESQRTLSTLMSNLPGMAYRCRNDKDWTMEFVSDGALELTGYRPSELIQNRAISYSKLIHPEDREYVWSEIHEALDEKRPFRLVYRIRSLEGTKWVWEQGQGIFSPEESLIALEGFINDITDRKLAEEALKSAHDELEKRVNERTSWLLRANEALHEEMAKHKKTEKELRRARKAADAASRAKGEFLANMSHEIRTPMNAVIGLSGLLLGTDLAPEQRDYVETIRSSGDALLAIINDILDFSKIDEGKMQIERQPFDLEECIESSLDLVEAKAKEKGLGLAHSVNESVPGIVLGDAARLRQVLVNLLSNAVKFTEKGDVSVLVSSGDTAGEIHFAVRDTGIGISEGSMSKLFQSFSQVDASTSRKYGGTGLGLAISRRLVELMGGRIWAESKVGSGSTFHFTIQAPATAGMKADDGLKGKRLLAILKDEGCKESLFRHALSWGVKISLARSSNQASEVLERESFDAALLDIQVPGAETLVSEVEGLMPIVTLMPPGHRLSGNASLTKPIKFPQLHSMLLKVLANKLPMNDAPSSDLHILLAEDNPVNQKVALLMLKRLGYSADVAGSGIEVLDLLGRKRYDVILMDVQMPEMDGLEAAKQIRGMGLECQPKILAMTAYALEGDRKKCLDAGMDGYISKPVQIEELRSALKGIDKAQGIS